jgi:hypothetical protein
VDRVNWASLWYRFVGWRLVLIVEAADDIPRMLPRNGAVLVRSQGVSKWLAFDCPCLTGHRIMLNLDVTEYPHWSAAHDGPLTIVPSIDSFQAGRRCHFVLRRGRVHWVTYDITVATPLASRFRKRGTAL